MASNIYATLGHLSNKYGSSGHYVLPEEMYARIDECGKTLFSYHSIPKLVLAANATVLTEEDIETITGMQWHALSEARKTHWREQTELLLSGSLSTLACPVAGYALDADIEAELESSRERDDAEYFARRDRERSEETELEDGEILDLDHLDHEMTDSDRVKRESPDVDELATRSLVVRSRVGSRANNVDYPTPVLDAFLDGPLICDAAGDFAKPIKKILDKLGRIQSLCPGVIMRCRSSRARLNYAPATKSFGGIAGHLWEAADQALLEDWCIDDIAHAFESMLRPFVCLNRDQPVCMVLNGQFDFTQEEAESYVPERMTLLEQLGLYEEFYQAWCRPLCPEVKHRVVAIMVNTVRNLISSANNSHELLMPTADRLPLLNEDEVKPYLTRMATFGLQTQSDGFVQQLLSCFDRQGLNSFRYHDMLEQKLCALNDHTGGLLSDPDWLHAESMEGTVYQEDDYPWRRERYPRAGDAQPKRGRRARGLGTYEPIADAAASAWTNDPANVWGGGYEDHRGVAFAAGWDKPSGGDEASACKHEPADTWQGYGHGWSDASAAVWQEPSGGADAAASTYNPDNAWESYAHDCANAPAAVWNQHGGVAESPAGTYEPARTWNGSGHVWSTEPARTLHEPSDGVNASTCMHYPTTDQDGNVDSGGAPGAD